MSTHSSILAWRIPWTESLVDYSPWGWKESDMTERLTLSTLQRTSTLIPFLVDVEPEAQWGVGCAQPPKWSFVRDRTCVPLDGGLHCFSRFTSLSMTLNWWEVWRSKNRQIAFGKGQTQVSMFGTVVGSGFTEGGTEAIGLIRPITRVCD